MNDDDGAVTVHAAWALGKIGPDAVTHLVAALKDEKLQHVAVVILGDIGPAAKAATASSISSGLAAPTIRPVSAFGTGEGAIGSLSATRDWLPAWASCAKILPRRRWTASTRRVSPGNMRSSWMPTWRAAYRPRGWQNMWPVRIRPTWFAASVS